MSRGWNQYEIQKQREQSGAVWVSNGAKGGYWTTPQKPEGYRGSYNPYTGKPLEGSGKGFFDSVGQVFKPVVDVLEETYQEAKPILTGASETISGILGSGSDTGVNPDADINSEPGGVDQPALDPNKQSVAQIAEFFAGTDLDGDGKTPEGSYAESSQIFDPYGAYQDKYKKLIDTGADVYRQTAGLITEPAADAWDKYVSDNLSQNFGDFGKLLGQASEELGEFMRNPVEASGDVVYDDIPKNLQNLWAMIFGELPGDKPFPKEKQYPDIKYDDPRVNQRSLPGQRGTRRLTGFGEPIAQAKTAPQPLGNRQSILSGDQSILSGFKDKGSTILG